LVKVIKEHQIKKENIYNFDEKGFLLGQGLKCRVITKRGKKSPKLTQDGSRELVTCIETISADGRVLPPMYIFKGTVHLKGWYEEVQKEDLATFATSPKGWTDSVLGLNYIANTFDKYTKDLYNLPSTYKTVY
jgi:hypothetical protein